MLAHWPAHPHVELVTTDGFLYPNAELERRGIMHRKGFPESYDRRALLRFVIGDQVRPRRGHRPDLLPPGLRRRPRRDGSCVKSPDIVIIEGLNVLQPARVREDGRTGLTLSDFFDFSVYVDAATSDIRQWYVERFQRLRETAFRDPASYFTRYAALSPEQAVAQAEEIWDTINGPNLAQNILPTRGRADLVLRKDRDHSVRYVRLRKISQPLLHLEDVLDLPVAHPLVDGVHVRVDVGVAGADEPHSGSAATSDRWLASLTARPSEWPRCPGSTNVMPTHPWVVLRRETFRSV